MTTPEDRINQLGWELGQAIQVIMASSFDRSYADVVHDYRRIEEDFISRPGGNDFHVLETKRRVAEAILLAAHSHGESFDICRNAWNDLVRLGFTNFRTKCTESWFYADCCLFNKEVNAGLAVLDPLIMDIEWQLEAMTSNDNAGQRLQDELARLKELRDELKAADQ